MAVPCHVCTLPAGRVVSKPAMIYCKLDLRTAFQNYPIMKPLAESRFANLRMTSENRFPIAMSQQRRTYIFRRLVDVALTVALVFSIASVRAADKGNWIGTSAASPQPVWNADFTAPINFPHNLWNQTIRQIARVSVGGSQVRVVLSNEYGSQPLVIGAAHIGLSDSGAAIKAGSDRVLTFSRNESFTIPPGALAISDPVDLSVPPLGSVAVSLFLPKVTPTETMHWDARQTSYVAAGNKVSDPDIKPDSKFESRLFLSGIMVDAPANHGGRKSPLAGFACGEASSGRWPSGSRPQRRNIGRSGAFRSHGRERAGALRRGCAQPPARGYGYPDDGNQRYRLARFRSGSARGGAFRGRYH